MKKIREPNTEPRLQLVEIPAKPAARTWHPGAGLLAQQLDTRHWSGETPAGFEWQRTPSWLRARHMN